MCIELGLFACYTKNLIIQNIAFTMYAKEFKEYGVTNGDYNF